MKGSIFTMSSGTDKNLDREISNSRSFRSIRAAKFLSERKVERLEIFRLQFLACQGDKLSVKLIFFDILGRVSSIFHQRAFAILHATAKYF